MSTLSASSNNDTLDKLTTNMVNTVNSNCLDGRWLHINVLPVILSTALCPDPTPLKKEGKEPYNAADARHVNFPKISGKGCPCVVVSQFLQVVIYLLRFAAVFWI